MLQKKRAMVKVEQLITDEPTYRVTQTRNTLIVAIGQTLTKAELQRMINGDTIAEIVIAPLS